MRHFFLNIFVLFFVCLLTFAVWVSPRTVQADGWQKRVDAVLLDGAASAEREFLVLMQDQADLSTIQPEWAKADKNRVVYQQLVAVAMQTQAPILAMIEAEKADYRAFWVTNAIWVKGDESLLKSLAARADVEHIYANTAVQFDAPTQVSSPLFSQSPSEWNIERIGAPALWALGYTGQGVVIGGADTGIAWEHPALVNAYRGWDGEQATHDYNWHDTIKETGGGRCGVDSAEPCDDWNFGHGTHTIGTAVGSTPTDAIGVAPGAKWIGCRNMNVGVGTPATYIACFEWFLAPTNLSGKMPDPSKGPDIINNSWSCPSSEGCIDPAIMQTVVSNVRAAGIFIVVSAGNTGGACGTIRTPIAIYDEAFTVGSTTSLDIVSGFSSRGPSTFGDGVLKPDVVAPGSGIRSAVASGSYASASGTSMAAPHVAGMVALLISAEPKLRGQVDELEQIIRENAAPLTSAQDCGNFPGAVSPNAVYGHGRIDVLRVYKQRNGFTFDINLPMLNR